MSKIMKVQAPMTIEDGKHNGVIVGIEYREKPYEYTDLIIEFEEGKRIKAGFPSFLSPTSKLGILLEKLGHALEIDKDIDIEECLMGSHITFMTMKTGKYANVVEGSIAKQE